MKNFQRRVELAEIMWGGFYRCPTTGRIREVLHGDDKILCNCGQSNPRVPQERTEVTGVHIIRFLQRASALEYVTEEDVRKERHG